MPAELSFDFSDAQLTRSNMVVIDELNLASGPGVVGVLGPNGSGKTTLLRALATVERPRRGRLTVYGNDVSEVEARRAARLRDSTLGTRHNIRGFPRGCALSTRST